MHPTVRRALRRLATALRRYVALPVLLMLLFSGLGAVSGASTPATYTGTTEIYLTSEGFFDPIGGLPQADPSRFLTTEADRLRTQQQLAAALTKAQDPRSTADLGAQLTVTPSLGSDKLLLELVDGDAQRAAQLVDAVATEYRDLRQREVDAAVSRAVDQARGDTGRIITIQSRAAVYGNGVQVLPSAVSQSPSPTSRDASLGALFGLLLGIGLVALLQRRASARATFVERLEARLDSPCLGSLPELEAVIATLPVPPPEGPAVDEVGRLAVTTLLAASHLGARTLLIVGSHVGVGATTVTANVALGVAMHGEQVLVLAARGRRPTAPDLGQLPTAAASSFWGLDYVLQAPEKRVAVRELTLQDPELQSAVAPGPLVLVDPGLALNDARSLQLSGMVDGVILVCGGRQDDDELEALGRLIDLSHVPLLGFVLNTGARSSATVAQQMRPSATARKLRGTRGGSETSAREA
jgi:capsular polysaccharide biosynthesis protein